MSAAGRIAAADGPPADAAAERAVLGAILLDPEALAAAAKMLRANDFYVDAHRKVFRAMASLRESGAPIDLVTLAARLTASDEIEAAGGHEYLAHLTDGLPRSANIEHYAAIVKDRAARRRAMRVADWLAGEAANAAQPLGPALARAAAAMQPPAPRAAATPGVLATQLRFAPVRWLWPGRIPCGKITVLDGDPGLGKSLITLDLAARVSRGMPMPDGAPGVAGGVVLASAEDGPDNRPEPDDDTIRPRLEAAGAKLDRVLVLPVAQFATVADIELLRSAIQRVEAQLVVVDPLMAYLGSGAECNSFRDQDIRAVLAPLAALAAETGAAILLVRHLRKSSADNPLYRGGGSIGIIGAARSGLLVAKDPEDPERRVLAATKSNLAREAASLAYRIVPAGDSAVGIEWLGAVAHDAAALLGPAADAEERGAMADAKDWLLERLAAGPVASADLFAEARAGGIKDRTLYRAKGALGVRARRTGFGGDGQWTWSLPLGCQGPKAANNGEMAAFEETPVNTGVQPKAANGAEIGSLCAGEGCDPPAAEPPKAPAPPAGETLGAAYARARREGRIAGPAPEPPDAPQPRPAPAGWGEF